MKMEQKAAVKAVTCRKVKETDKTDWILSNYAIKIYAKIRSCWPCRTLLGHRGSPKRWPTLKSMT